MRAKIIETVRSVLSAPPSHAEDVLYMMHRPRRAPKAASVSLVAANLKSIERDEGKVCSLGAQLRLSFRRSRRGCAVWPYTGKPKCKKWAQALFESAPTSSPRLRFDVRFWCTAWGPEATGIWREISPCPFAFAKYLLIGVAAYLFPGDLLNDEGVDRAASAS